MASVLGAARLLVCPHAFLRHKLSVIQSVISQSVSQDSCANQPARCLPLLSSGACCCCCCCFIWFNLLDDVQALKLSYASVQQGLRTKHLPVQEFLRLMWAVGH